MPDVLTCVDSLRRPGICCDNGADDPGPDWVQCGEPARYAILVAGPLGGPPREHLRCVRHAASTRVAAGDLLLAMKDYRPRDGYGVGLAPAT